MEINHKQNHDQIKNVNNSNIGIYKERSLHAAIKSYYEPDLTRHETPLLGYIADIYNEAGVTEVQTRDFFLLRKKLEAFLPEFPVTIIYPAIRQKWLLWIDPKTGEVSSRRRSPKIGTPYSIYDELYGIKTLLTHTNLRIKVLMVDVEEYRQLNGWSQDRKRGSTRTERIPVGIGDEVLINNKHDYLKLIPDTLPSFFYTADFARNAKISRYSAQKALNILYYVEIATRTGRNKKGYIYTVNKNFSE